MNDNNQPRALEADALDPFELQLRSLAPREANIPWAAIEAAARDSQPLNIGGPAKPAASRRYWTAALLASWSLGAAAGVGGTLLCTRWLPGILPATEQTAGGAAITSPLGGQAPSVAIVPAPAKERHQPLATPTPSRPANATWQVSSWSEPLMGARSPAAAQPTLTPLSLASEFANETARWQSIGPTASLASRSQPASPIASEQASHDAGQQKAPTSAGDNNLQPSPADEAKPANQRKLLQHLLSSFGAS